VTLLAVIRRAGQTWMTFLQQLHTILISIVIKVNRRDIMNRVIISTEIVGATGFRDMKQELRSQQLEDPWTLVGCVFCRRPWTLVGRVFCRQAALT